VNLNAQRRARAHAPPLNRHLILAFIS
jgi:hypothetical protein